MDKQRWRRGALLLMAALALSACGAPAEQSSAPTPRAVPDPEITVVGKPVLLSDRPAPQIVATTVTHDTFDLAEHRGSVILLNFWATWCAPCVVETPLLVETYATMRDSGLVVVGISMDREGFDVVRPFADRFEVDYPMILDQDFGEALGGTYMLPTTFLIDRRGNVASRINGILQEDVLRQELARLL